MEDYGVSNAEYLVHLVWMNRLSACREFCGVHSLQNGTKCRDGVKVLRCHFPSTLVGLGFHPYMHLFSFRNFFWHISVAFFLYCCLGMVREKRGRRGGWGEDAWSIKYDNNIQLFCSHKIKNHHKFKCLQMDCKSNHHTSLSMGD